MVVQWGKAVRVLATALLHAPVGCGGVRQLVVDETCVEQLIHDLEIPRVTGPLVEPAKVRFALPCRYRETPLLPPPASVPAR
jgi:hypothetical protein